MKNIHVIPTGKPSRLFKFRGLKLTARYYPQNGLICLNQHIYITSDEEIREHDSVILKSGRLVKAESDCVTLGFNSIDSVAFLYFQKGDNKVILTTDQDLIKDGVQSIDDDFLGWFVKNPSCEEVEIRQLFVPSSMTYGINTEPYKIIIPTEESKQETLEEAIERLKWEIDRPSDFIKGAAWQAERMYSEEEISTSFNHLGFKQITSKELNSLPYQPFITDENGNIWVIDKEQWFKQFQKAN